MPTTANRPRKVQTEHAVSALLREPKRLKIRHAAIRIGVSYSTIWNAVKADVFTVIAPKGRGPGKPIWLHTDEVDAFSDGREDAVRAIRLKLKRLKTKRA